MLRAPPRLRAGTGASPGPRAAPEAAIRRRTAGIQASMALPLVLAALETSALLAVLVQAALAALIAFLAALLLRARPPVLSLVGAGLLGAGIGTFLGAAVGGLGWPFTVAVAGASLHVTWTFVGALLTLYVARVARTRRWR